MVRDIDDFADEQTRNIQTAGEKFHADFLEKRPKPEWPPYIDETAQDISANIQISDTNLSSENFGSEVGEYYRRGLVRSTGEYTDLPDVLGDQISDDKLGVFTYKLNELNFELSTADTGLDNVQNAVEAVIAKVLTRQTGKDLAPTFDIEGGSVADIAMQVFQEEAIANNIDILIDEFEKRAGSGLLSLLDEPQMMTTLWDHQREALQAWDDQNFRGYVDMATATGKTVLGLAALALRYGKLHPKDQSKVGLTSQRDANGRDDILIVAHNDLILEQWRREFDRHLNIPKERTQRGDDISLTWGDIHFRTPQKLVNKDRIEYDLVILDEAHHYALSSEWGSLLDEFSNEVMALSGSVDDAGSDSQRIQRRLQNSIGGELKGYTIKEAKADGIIPSFDWEIRYTAYGGQREDLEQISRRAEEAFQSFRKRLEGGDLTIKTSRRLHSFVDIRNFSHTSEGKKLKQNDEAFRDLVTRLFSRRTKRWNLSPTLETIVEIVVEHVTNKKVVVLADSNAQIEELEARLDDIISDSESIRIVSKSKSKEEQLEIIDQFDESEAGGVLLGTGDLLGEGVDIQHASVAINMATGGVNPELVQRIGRVLRNPVDDPKHAMFYNVVGLPPTIDAAIPREDGKRVIEEAASFCSLGSRFDKLPGFSAAASLNPDTFATLLSDGASFISDLEANHSLDWDESEAELKHLHALRQRAHMDDGSIETILGKWEEYALEHSSAPSEDISEESQTVESEESNSQRDKYIQALQQVGESTDGVLTARAVNTQIEYSVTNIVDEFGSWKAALEAAGIENDERLLSELHRVAEQVGHPPTRSEFEEYGKIDPSVYADYYGTYTKAFDEAFDQKTLRRRFLKDIRMVAETTDQIPLSSVVDSHIDYPVNQIIREFGSWQAALDAAGVEYKERLQEELRRVANEVGHEPSTTEVNEYGNVSASTYSDYFDSFSQAIEATFEDLSEPGSSGEAADKAGGFEFVSETTSLTVDSLPSDGQVSDPFTIKLIGNIFAPKDDHEADLHFEDIDGQDIWMTIWEDHDKDDTNWENGNWYTITNFRVGKDGSDGLNGPLHSTSDLGIISHGQTQPKTPERDKPPSSEKGESEPEEPPIADHSEDEAPSPTRHDPTQATLDERMPESNADEAQPQEADVDQPEKTSAEGDQGERETGESVPEYFWDSSVDPLQKTEAVENGGTSGNEIDDTRAQLDRKIDEWKSQLLDLTRRNKLISFKATKTKSLPFEDANPVNVAGTLLDEGELFIHKNEETAQEPAATEIDSDEQELLSSRTPDETDTSLYNIGLNHKQHLRERGVDTLYLALGMLEWYSVDYSDSTLRSPLFLLPVELGEKTLRDSNRHNYVLEPKAEGLRFNPALRKKLGAEQGIEFPTDEALNLNDIDAAFEAVHEAVVGFDRWTVENDVILGIFDFVKFSIYNDLEENREKIKSHPIVQALVDNTEPLREKEGSIESPSAEELDEVVDPIDTYQVLDADSSQQEAIEAAKRGKSFVLQGPPGTGKSQTIANIIAEKLAHGESVLFVSEKQAALNVVKDRLDSEGIGRFCLEAHGRKANKNQVLGTLEDELKRSRVKRKDERKTRLAKLRERRDAINEYGSQLFHSPEEWEITVYQAFGIVSSHEDAPRVDVNIDAPLDIPQETVESAIDELETLSQFETELNEAKSNPWRHTSLRSWGVDTGEMVRESLESQRIALDELIAVSETIEQTFGFYPSSIVELREARDFLDHLTTRPRISWHESLFEEAFLDTGGRFNKFVELERERNELHEELAENYERSFFSTDAASLHDELAGYGFFKFIRPSYRSLKRRILTHAKDGYSPGYSDLLEDVRKLSELQRLEELRADYQDVKQQLGPLYKGEDTDWDQLEAAQEWLIEFQRYPTELTEPLQDALLQDSLGDVTHVLDQTETAIHEFDDAAEFFEDVMQVHKISINHTPFKEASYSSVRDFLGELHATVPELESYVRFLNQLDTVRDTICGDYADNFIEADHVAQELVPGFKKNFYTAWLNGVYEQTNLDSFSVDTMEQYLREFRALDQEQQELARIEIQHRVTNRRPSLDLEYATSSEQVVVRREIQKERRHKPLRELFDEASSYITKLTPCFMMSPLSVAQFLKSDSIQFDTVIFDEASQIMPEDAISSLIRADQAVIAGDTKQLPPTTFFQADVETTEDVREDLESILEETASVIPEKHLRWHYRSRTDELIEFSNHQYYDNSLRTFPENDPEVETGVRFEYVPDGVYDRGGSRQNIVEAERVIDLVEEHAENHSEKSLGVVAFSSAQEQAIRDELQERREENPVLDSFVNQDDILDEFFIKSLEMVQGDERDRMIFSVGYGYDQAGKMSMNFGPLNNDGGERRLNVAVTRARELVTVVSSIKPEDIDLSSTNSTGVKHFKQYLEYARDGPSVLARDVDVSQTLDFDSEFEEAVYDELTARGFDVSTQIESSGYSIDLGIKHPEKPGKYILGIECDGAAYHSSKTARDRDRIRQSVLEDLGWTIHRIWSPDWVSNKEKEISKIEDRVERLLEDAEANGGAISAESDEVQSYEAETFDDDEAKTAHSEITSYDHPSLPTKRDRDFDDIRNSTIRSNLVETVNDHGPIKSDVAYRELVQQWHITRLGKRIRRKLNGHATSLHQKGKLFRHDGFLWPSRGELDFTVRIHDGEQSRDINEIPIQEIAKAAAVILKEGGSMTKDDLALETAKLFGYERRGSRIQERIGKGVELLEEKGLVTGEKQIRIQNEDEIDTRLLEDVY